MKENFFKNKKPNSKKLLEYGFEKTEENFIYKKELSSLGMRLEVSIENEKISAHVFDVSSSEEYILHLTEAQGNFVGEVRCEYENILYEISRLCFDDEVFKNSQTKRVISYVKEKYGDIPEFLWDSYPEFAAIRRGDTKKWYGVIMKISEKKLGFSSDKEIEVINLHAKNEDVPILVDNINYFPGWHMNKKYWITVILNNSLSDKELFKRIDESYALGKK